MILWIFIEFFGVKIVITDIYRYFTDILPIFFQKFQHKRSCSIVAIFRRKINYFIDFSPIFPLINFFSAFSFRYRLKTDFSMIYRQKKMIFCSTTNYLFYYIFFLDVEPVYGTAQPNMPVTSRICRKIWSL